MLVPLRLLDVGMAEHQLNRADGLASNQLLHESPHLREVQRLAGPRDTHSLILLPIEMTGSSIHRDDQLRVCGKGALEKTVVGFVPDDTELGQRIAHREALDNFSDELWMIAEDVRVLLQDGGADPSVDKPARASS